MIGLQADGGVLTITLNHPERKNALNLDMVRTVRGALRDVDTSTGEPARVLLLRSAVKGVFSLGMDLAALQQGLDEGASSPQVHQAVGEYATLLKEILAFRGVTIAEVGGLAIGGGVDLLAACDVVIASQNAAFSIAQLRKGIFPLTTSGVVIPRIGQRAFMFWALSGQNWSAQKALSMGLISQIVKADALAERVARFCEQILQYDANALQLGIDAVRVGPNLTPADRLEHLGALLALNAQIPSDTGNQRGVS